MKAPSSAFLKEGERLDDLQRNGYYIIQHPQTFCFGMDAVLLSSFARVAAGESVLDIGCGNGVIPLLLAGKSEGHFTGLEIQDVCADMAERSVRLNHLEERISIVRGDIRRAGAYFAPSSFQVITANPPYLKESGGVHGENAVRDIARHELCCTLEDVISAAAKLLVDHGRLYLAHRPFRLTDVLALLRQYRLEPKTLKTVQARQNEPPKLLLIEAVRGAGAHLFVDAPLIVYNEAGEYTPEMNGFYGNGR